MASSSSASSTRPKPIIKNKEEDISVIEYPFPSTFNVANVVTIKLTKDNYELWVEQIWSLVDILELRDFLEKELPTYTSRTDKLLRGWILATLSEDVLKIVKIKRHFSTSRSVMIKIEETLVEDIHERILSPKSETMSKKDKSIFKYMPLYEAAIAGNWEATKSILDGDKEAATAIITENDFSLLHVAVVTGKHIDFVQNLVEYLPTHALTLKDESTRTALHIAAMVGNMEAVKILKNKNPAPLSLEDAFGYLPLHFGISYEHGDTYLYFKELCNDEHYHGVTVASFLASMIGSDAFDFALGVFKDYPAMELEISSCESVLNWMVEMPSYFRSGISLNFLESFIYSCVPVKSVSFIRGYSDVENHDTVHLLGDISAVFCKILHLELWDVIDLLVPSIKIIRQKKLLHHQAVQLLKLLCKAVKSLNDEASFHSRLSKALTKAARHGIVEVVEEILRTFPSTIWSRDGSKHNIFEIALINRCEKVFNISYQMNELQEYLKFRIIDGDQNSMLHLAGRLAPPQKLNLISGAALQMQRELQWYKEVEKLSNPYLRVYHNSSKETPAMVFTREHKELVVEGEKWMKDTANSCSIAAALIITVVFAAAITVPGGNKDNGPPVFNNNPAFLIFAVSDTAALFMSTTSLLMFLSILTARYAEEDFLYTLPKRLVFGLLTLFLSITSMVIAFSSAVYLVFGGRNGWVIIPLAALSCLPVTSFVRLQFPLLIDVYSSTYGRGIFGEQSDRPFHRHIKGFLQYIVKCFASTQKYISHILFSSS